MKWELLVFLEFVIFVIFFSFFGIGLLIYSYTHSAQPVVAHGAGSPAPGHWQDCPDVRQQALPLIASCLTNARPCRHWPPIRSGVPQRCFTPHPFLAVGPVPSFRSAIARVLKYSFSYLGFFVDA